MQMMSNVALLVGSESLSVDEMLVHLPEAAWSAERGTPVSSRRPDGPKRQATLLRYPSDATGDDVTDHLDSLDPVLKSVELAVSAGVDLSARLTFMVEPRPMGYQVWIDADDLARLNRAGCGIVMGVYEADEQDSDQ